MTRAFKISLALGALITVLLLSPDLADAREKWFYDATSEQTHWHEAFERPTVLFVGATYTSEVWMRAPAIDIGGR
jgi:hypothetical protein